MLTVQIYLVLYLGNINRENKWGHVLTSSVSLVSLFVTQSRYENQYPNQSESMKLSKYLVQRQN